MLFEEMCSRAKGSRAFRALPQFLHAQGVLTWASPPEESDEPRGAPVYGKADEAPFRIMRKEGDFLQNVDI